MLSPVRLILTVMVLLLSMSAGQSMGSDLFVTKVAPLFERHCVACHQGEKPKGSLSLVTAKQALAGGDSGSLLEPGKPDESLLLELLSGDKPAMPKGAKPLAAAEIEAIRQWIEEGAHWPAEMVLQDKKLAGADDDWWSLRALKRPAVPDARGNWVRTPIDAFILTKLGQHGLEPSPEADRRTLVRRLTYDLHGLPPTPDEIQRFLADNAPNAYERLVDRLLESPRYGERWGRHWLDVVHYGESHGYDKDKPRPNAWPYRDYVINSFNSDKSYRQFVEEQLAGDVLFPDDPQAIVATGFIAAGPWDFVGHAELREGTLDKKITRSNDRDDMVAAAMSTFQSLTVHCARCHNHKFDPIPQEDYYRLQTVFAGVDRADRAYDLDADTFRRRRELLGQRDELVRRQKSLDELLAKISSPEIRGLDGQLAALRQDLNQLPQGAKDASPTNGYHSAIESQAEVTKWVQVDLGRLLPLERLVLVPARPVDFPDTPGFGFPVRFKVETAENAEFREAQIVADQLEADFTNPGDEPPIVPLKNCTARYVRITATRLWKRTNDFVFSLAELQAISAGENVAFGSKVSAHDSIEAGLWSTRHLVDGFSSRARLADAESLKVVAARRAAIETKITELAAARRDAVDAILDQATRAEMKAVAASTILVNGQLADLPTQPFVYAATNHFPAAGTFSPAETPRPVYFLHRGSDKTPGREMEPGALSCVTKLPSVFTLENLQDEGTRRAALAKWIVDPRNPLTRRSIVNRIWQYHFGRGIVDTPNDFGHLGSLPTHPELLDWLAVELSEPSVGGIPSAGTKQGEWSLKRLHRLILTSAVYRQSSRHNTAAATIDSGNQFLWRMNRQRLEAESIRDAILAVSGKLDLQMGGPSDQQFFFKDDHSPVYDYERFDVDSPHACRRSIYRFIVRSVPDPFMECLDCADPSLLTPKRNTTLTALQALSLMNNQFVLRQAEHFAERLQRISADPREQVTAAHELALGRPPTDKESQTLLQYVARHGLANGCRVLLNSNEFVFVD